MHFSIYIICIYVGCYVSKFHDFEIDKIHVGIPKQFLRAKKNINKKMNENNERTEKEVEKISHAHSKQYLYLN